MEVEEQFVVCTYGDHGYGYQPIGIYQDYDLAKVAMKQATKDGKHVEVWAFDADGNRRRVTQWHAQ